METELQQDVVCTKYIGCVQGKFKGYKIFNNIMDGIIKEYEIMGYHIVP